MNDIKVNFQGTPNIVKAMEMLAKIISMRENAVVVVNVRKKEGAA